MFCTSRIAMDHAKSLSWPGLSRPSRWRTHGPAPPSGITGTSLVMTMWRGVAMLIGSPGPEIDFLHLLAGADLLRRAGLQNLAEMQDRDVIGDVEHDVHVMLDQQDRQVGIEPHEEFCHLLRLARRQAGGRLVQQQDFWITGETENDLELALLAVREIAHLHVHAILKTGLPQKMVGLGIDVAIRGHEAPCHELGRAHALD